MENNMLVKWSCGCIGIHTAEQDIMIKNCDSDRDSPDYSFYITDRCSDKTFEPLENAPEVIEGIHKLLMDGERFRVIKRALS